MTEIKNKANSPIPEVFICIGYKSVYDDYETVDINKVIEGIPTMAILNFIVKQQDRVLYAFSDAATQRQQIRDFVRYVPTKAKQRIWHFTRQNEKCLLYESYGCTMAFGYALQNFTPFDEDDDYIELCEDEYERVFKLILYCNQKWTDGQAEGGVPKDLIEASIKIDLPIVEFKLYKDFKYQIYKAIPFFKFLESDTHYKQILPLFYADKKVTCWQEYIGRLFNFYAQSLKGRFIKVDTADPGDNEFVKQYSVDLKDFVELSKDHNALNYLRDHFLIDCSSKNFMFLNANLLVDKIYQGMRFDVYRTVEAHGILNKKGKKYNGYPDFSSCLGQDFSEPELLYSLIQKTFESNCSKLFMGEYLKSQGLEAEPDLYMRIGSVLYLFEFKDVILGDRFKYSSDMALVKRSICERICLLDGEKRKGAGQLHHTIKAIFENHVMDSLDPDVSKVTDIVPIVVTTDRAFSAIGVQALVVEEYNKYPKIHFSGFISVPIVIELDTLIDLSYRFNVGVLDFTNVIKDYMYNKCSNLQPFSTFIVDKYARPGNVISRNEVEYLFAEIIKYM